MSEQTQVQALSTPVIGAPSPEALVSALGAVAEGEVYDLATEISVEMPMGPKETYGQFTLTQYRTPQCLTGDGDPPPFDFSMDVVHGSPHMGTHIDAPAHILSEGRVHGGASAASVYGDFGWAINGAETVPPMLGRGILVDVGRQLGPEPLPDLFEITVEHLEATLEAQGTTLREGDVVLVRTGKFLADYKGDGAAYFGSEPGVGVPAAEWLLERGMAMLGTDTAATEPLPYPDPATTVHRRMLVERGIPLLEILDLERLAEARRYEFLFICLPLKFKGATGSWVRPVAVV